MTTPVQSRWRAALTMRLLTDLLRQSTLNGIQKVAPQSPLMNNPAIAASYGALGTKGAKLAADLAKAAADEKAYKVSLGTADTSRVDFDLELDTLKTLVENNSKTAADLISMGFAVFTATPAAHTVPEPPSSLLVKTGKAPRKARVVVDGKGYLGTFAAQVSTEPIGPTTWENLPGNGKQRKLYGYPSGTRLYVRFATVRYGLQSAWSTPVLVTIP